MFSRYDKDVITKKNQFNFILYIKTTAMVSAYVITEKNQFKFILHITTTAVSRYVKMLF